MPQASNLGRKLVSPIIIIVIGAAGFLFLRMNVASLLDTVGIIMIFVSVLWLVGFVYVSIFQRNKLDAPIKIKYVKCPNCGAMIPEGSTCFCWSKGAV